MKKPIKKIVEIKHRRGEIDLSKICQACVTCNLTTWEVKAVYDDDDSLHDVIYLTNFPEGMEDVKDVLNMFNQENDLTYKVLEEDKSRNFIKIEIQEWDEVVECYNIKF